MAAGHDRLPYLPLLQFTIADEAEGSSLGTADSITDRKTHRLREPLTKGPTSDEKSRKPGKGALLNP